MGDMGDDFRAWKEQGKQKREDNRKYSPQVLKTEGVKFDRKNWGAHLIVHGNNETIDFWPGTGKWIVRGGKTSRGVFALIKYIKKQAAPLEVPPMPELNKNKHGKKNKKGKFNKDGASCSIYGAVSTKILF
jgi:hypothetical protein